MTSKKQCDDFVNECQKTARRIVNDENVSVKVEFRVWKDGNKMNCTSDNLKTTTISFPPTKTPADLAAENAQLREKLQQMNEKHSAADLEIELLKKKLDLFCVKSTQ